MNQPRTVLWLVGEPGSGKTSLARALLGPEALSLIAKPKWTLVGTTAAAGHYTGAAFDGADTIPYNGAAEALDYWQAHLSTRALTLLDGDRFSNENTVKFFRERAAADPGLRLVCAYVDVPAEVAAARRAARSETVQNAAWVAGRGTKARRFHEGFLDAVTVNGQDPVEAQKAALYAHLSNPAPVAPEAGSDGILGLF